MKRHYLRKTGLLCTLIGGSLFWPLTGYAAEESAPPAEQTVDLQREFTLEGLFITATRLTDGYVAKNSTIGTKTDTPLSETAQSISVITREQMEARGVQSLDEALAYTPGVSAGIWGKDGRGNSTIKIRGFGSGVRSTFTDGLRAPYGSWSAANTDTYAFERIEILRGPASVLYGFSNPGGLINQVTKRPTEHPIHEIQLQAGNHANKGASLDIGGPVHEDGKLLFRFTARAQEQDFEQDYSSGKRTFIAPALTWQPDDATKLTILANYQKNKIKGNYFGNRRIYDSEHTLHGYRGTLFTGEPDYDRFEQELKEIGYIFEHQFNDVWSVTQTARHSDIDLLSKYLGIDEYSGTDGRTLSRYANHITETLRADAVDTHFQAKWSAGSWTHTTLLGFDYLRSDFDNRWGSGSAPSLDLITLNYGQAVTTPETVPNQMSHMRQRGLYLQEQAKFGDRWVFMAGGRRDWFEDDLNSIKQAANTGRAGLVYHATNELSPYFSYAESFEPQSGADRHGKAFVPTTGRQYELGIQYEPAGANARFSAAIFDLRQQNALTDDPLNSASEWFSVQIGEIASKGLELEANLTTAKGVNLLAAYTLLDHKTTKSSDPAAIGRRGAGVSRHSAALWANYTVPEGRLKGLGFGGGVRYIGSRYNNMNTEKYPGILLADAMLRYDLAEWRLALNVRNLFDKFYNVSGNFAGEGRAVLLTATRRW